MKNLFETLKKYKIETAAALVVLANYIYIAANYARLPQNVAIKWSFTGEVRDTAAKWVLLLIPLLSVIAFFYDKARGRNRPYATLIVAVVIFVCLIVTVQIALR